LAIRFTYGRFTKCAYRSTSARSSS
jgi:hypothetical protein